MSPKDLLLALVVVVAWGVNFVVIKVGLHGVPPMLLGALRFLLAAIPAVFFVKRPQLPLRWLLAYARDDFVRPVRVSLHRDVCRHAGRAGFAGAAGAGILHAAVRGAVPA